MKIRFIVIESSKYIDKGPFFARSSRSLSIPYEIAESYHPLSYTSNIEAGSSKYPFNLTVITTPDTSLAIDPIGLDPIASRSLTQESHRLPPIQHSVIISQRNNHDWPDFDFPIDDVRLFFDGVHS